MHLIRTPPSSLRFTDMFGIQLTNDAIAQLYSTPAMFRFVPRTSISPT